MKYFIITLLFTLNVFAGKYVVISKKRSFTLVTTETSIHYKSSFQDLTVKSSSCTKRYISILNSEIKQALKKKAIKNSAPNMLLKMNKKEYKLDPSSNLAQFFYNLRERIIKLKAIEGQNCG